MMEKLTETQLAGIFEREIRPELDRLSNALREVTKPVVVFVGGQPGAGKSRAISRLEKEYPGIVAVVGDDLRAYHPDYDRVMANDPLAMPGLTAQASGRWVEMSIAYLRENRIDTLIETTLRQVSVVSGTVADFRQAGYRTELHVVAVPLEVSRLGIVTRYLGQVEESGAGRWTPSAAHAVAAAAVSDTVIELVESGAMDHVVVEDRGGKVYYDANPRAGEYERSAHECASAIAKARDVAAMNQAEARIWLNEATEAMRSCVDTKQSDPDLLATIRCLVEQDAPHVASAAYPEAPSAQQEALHALRAEYLPLTE